MHFHFVRPNGEPLPRLTLAVNTTVCGIQYGTAGALAGGLVLGSDAFWHASTVLQLGTRGGYLALRASFGPGALAFGICGSIFGLTLLPSIAAVDAGAAYYRQRLPVFSEHFDRKFPEGVVSELLPALVHLGGVMYLCRHRIPWTKAPMTNGLALLGCGLAVAAQDALLVRCSACRTVSYCGPVCQTADWKAHKTHCKAFQKLGQVPPVPETLLRRLEEMLRVGRQHTIYEQSSALGLDPSLISGTIGADVFKESGEKGHFWRLGEDERKKWDDKAAAITRKAQQFWISYLSPLTVKYEWVDIVLDAVLNVRLPGYNNVMWQNQVNANILAGLFPHLHRFTPTQNTTLLDIFASPAWHDDGTFRLETGTTVLFAHGRPTANLIDQLIGRCLSWTRPYSEIDKLLCCVALPIQKCWPDIAGTRILDLAFAMLSPGRPGPAKGRTVPGDKILEIAETSPTACKHLLPVIHIMCRARSPPMISHPDNRILELCESFGISLRDDESGLTAQLARDFRFCAASTSRMERLVLEGRAGELDKYGISIKDHSLAELRQMNKEAMDRLGNPQIL
ncbi:MYND-type domain-containing protein [Mycena indigotica]|uniref:MYND-type domain-containing protein n=1 Tax=Mycena indigotica TaxID=2126181 RepID=A0A8H6SZP1_9AGAR|nr:MYND-type domain-containing protein [Mycena indigotica]KAF7309260.1 MYND-type domain-containing protein [Mycena indigotica]